MFSGEEAPNVIGWSKAAISRCFSLYNFESFRNKANIVLQHDLDPHWLSTNLKIDDFE